MTNPLQRALDPHDDSLEIHTLAGLIVLAIAVSSLAILCVAYVAQVFEAIAAVSSLHPMPDTGAFGTAVAAILAGIAALIPAMAAAGLLTNKSRAVQAPPSSGGS